MKKERKLDKASKLKGWTEILEKVKSYGSERSSQRRKELYNGIKRRKDYLKKSDS